MYLARIYIPSNSRLELWRRSRPVGLSVLVKLRDARRGVAEPASVDLTFINGRQAGPAGYPRILGGSRRGRGWYRRARCERAGRRSVPGPLQPRTPPRNLIGPNGASTSIINRVQNINDTVTVFQKLNQRRLLRVGSRGTILPTPSPLPPYSASSLSLALSFSLVLSLCQFVVFVCAPSVDHVRTRRNTPASSPSPCHLWCFYEDRAINFNIIAYCSSNCRKARVTAAAPLIV